MDVYLGSSSSPVAQALRSLVHEVSTLEAELKRQTREADELRIRTRQPQARRDTTCGRPACRDRWRRFRETLDTWRRYYERADHDLSFLRAQLEKERQTRRTRGSLQEQDHDDEISRGLLIRKRKADDQYRYGDAEAEEEETARKRLKIWDRDMEETTIVATDSEVVELR